MARVYDILRKPLLTEKSLVLRDKDNKYVFLVAKNANKHEIAEAVETIFKVKVERVATSVLRGRVKRVGRFEGKRPDFKKAFVTLKKGDKIDTAEAVSK